MNRENITAQWARETSQKVLGEKIKREINKCLDAIEISVKANDLSCSVNFYADNLTIKELERRGFKASAHSDQREGSWTQINW